MKRTKQEALETRAAILDAAERVMSAQGLTCTTMAQIAAAANVTRGAIYWHFKNKAEIIDAVIERVRLPMQEMFYNIVAPADEEALLQIYDGLRDMAIYCLIQLHDSGQIRRVHHIVQMLHSDLSADLDPLRAQEQEARAQILKALTLFFEKMKEKGHLKSGTEPRIAALALHGYIAGLHVDYLQSAADYRMSEDAAHLIDPVFKAFLT